jgi:phosphoenolpyruvate synthase/pyruvate phosphate dikinase
VEKMAAGKARHNILQARPETVWSSNKEVEPQRQTGRIGPDCRKAKQSKESVAIFARLIEEG